MMRLCKKFKLYIMLYRFLLFFILISYGCSDEDIVTDNSNNNKEIYSNMDKTIQQRMEQFHIPGIVVGIIDGNKEINYIKAFGYADKFTKRLLKTSDIFRIGSNTKTFTVTALLQLVDEGKLSLDDKLNKFLPDFPNADKVTIKQLCNMTSGIFNYSETEEFANAIISNPTGYLSPDVLINFAKQHPYYFEPGTQYYYSNTNTIIIGKIIEMVTGDKLEGQIKKRFIDKLGLYNTTFPTSKYLWGDHARGYGSFVPGTSDMDVTDLYDVSWAWSAGAMTSNVYDLTSWVKHLATGTLLSAETHQKRFEFVTVSQELDFKYGLGLVSLGGFIGHNGALPGYLSIMVYSPERNATFVILMNIFYSDESGTSPLNLFLELSKMIYNDLPWQNVELNKINKTTAVKKYLE